MQRENESRKLIFCNVLKLIYVQDQRGVAFSCGTSDRCQEIGKVGRQVSAVGDTSVRLDVDTYFNVLILQFERADKARKRPHCGPCAGAEGFFPVEADQGRA